MLQGTELGFIQTQQGYQFLSLDRDGKWQPLEDSGALRARTVEQPFYLQLRVDGRPVGPVKPPDERDTDQAAEVKPQILLLSSGEATPFVLDVRARDYEPHYTLEGDLLGRMKLEHRDTAS